ncbi:Yip1 family protein [Streptomyces sp. NPDC058440]|uniref:Yip1 family protein n=1 Tax=Streptomyces sp. NPDC058440 TaxID=3346501 RepID=UPI0036618F90
MPRSLSAALVLVHTLFVATVLGGIGVLLTAGSYGALDGGVIALVAYAAVPGVLGWWLARRSWEGGGRIRWALVAVQVWLILGGLANLTAGSARGGIQLFLPVLILYFLLQSETRQWFELPVPARAERRPFSLARMIRWRGRDEGQTAVEYAGLVAIVVAIVLALVVSGLGTQILTSIEAQVCKVAGMGCAAPTGNGDGTDTHASDDTSGATTGGGTDSGGATTGGGADSGGGTTGGGADSSAGGSATGGGDQSTGGTTTDSGDQTTEDTPTTESDDNDTDTDNTAAPGEKKDDGCFSGFGAFFGCAGDQLKQVGEGVFVDGIWGDVTGIWDMVTNPGDTLSGIADYGKQLGHDWMEDSKDAGKKWSDGDWFGALWDWGGASLNTGGTVLWDMFIGDDVAEDWKNGEKTRAVSHVVWNIGSLFIPGYDIGKVAEKVGDLGKIGKLGKLGKLAEKATEAAEDAKKAAKAGDVEGAERAAKKADDAADEAEKKARESGCSIAAPARRIPYGDGGGPGGGAGTGTTVLAAGGPRYVVLAQEGCDEEAKKEAAEARKQADEAEHAASAAELAHSKDAAKKALDDEGVPYSKKNADDFAGRAKDNPDPDKKEIGTKDATRALDEIEKLAKTPNVSKEARSTLTSKILNAKNTDELAQARAELNAVQHAADAEAAAGTTVHTAVGKDFGKTKVDLGNGESVDISDIQDADTLYKGKDGKVHVVEVKNTGNATIKADFERQVEDMARWQGKDGAGRAVRVDIATDDKWSNIFSGYKTGKRDGVKYRPPGTPASTLAKNNVPVRIAGQDISPGQLARMQAEIDARRAAGTMEWSRMATPKEAMEYLGVS